MLQSLAERGVDVSAVIVDPGQKTGFSVILNRIRDRAILTFTGAINALKAEQVTDDLLRKARHLHVASYFLQTSLLPGLPDLFRRARQLGLTISLDTNWDPDEEWRGVEKLLPLVDVFLPNESEAKALTGLDDPAQAAGILAGYTRTVAVKLGAAGAIARQGSVFAQTGSLAVEVADSVGAGDSFDAGFIYGYLGGWPLEKCLQLGAACGSLSTRVPGGTEGQPSLEEALGSIRSQAGEGQPDDQ
jgi:sugar/nucleoside kinase (ribokinase family)